MIYRLHPNDDRLFNIEFYQVKRQRIYQSTVPVQFVGKYHVIVQRIIYT